MFSFPKYPPLHNATEKSFQKTEKYSNCLKNVSERSLPLSGQALVAVGGLFLSRQSLRVWVSLPTLPCKEMRKQVCAVHTLSCWTVRRRSVKAISPPEPG